MGLAVEIAVVLVAFLALVGCMLYVDGIEKYTGLPRRRAFYVLLGILLAVVVGLFALYHLGLIEV